MADIREFPDVPGYVSIKQAAEMLGITDKRGYWIRKLGDTTGLKFQSVHRSTELQTQQE